MNILIIRLIIREAIKGFLIDAVRPLVPYILLKIFVKDF
jgi:hypothetical protein